MSSIYQLKVSLKNSNPEIYRTVLVDKKYDFYIFHLIIQGLMNWTNAYYYEFSSDNLKILDENLPDYKEFALSDEITLQEVLQQPNDEINYLYDEQDMWELSIRLEKVLPRKRNHQYPLCIDGKYNSPPEDCGGLESFESFVKNLKDPKFIPDDELMDFFGDDYDIKHFDIVEKNKFLSVVSKQYYEKSEFNFDDDEFEYTEFDGYNYDEMESIVTKEFSDQWPIILKNMSPKSLAKIPILNMMLFVMERIDQEKEIKLTTRGNFPRFLVTELYDQRYYLDDFIEAKVSKLSKEEDVEAIHLTHILLEISHYIKKRNNKLSLTKKGKQALNNRNQMLHEVFVNFCNNYNWGYFDAYENELIGRFGFGYSIILLSKYGESFQDIQFYSDKYFEAFPTLNYNKKDYLKDLNTSCYSIRTFERFLHLFGLVEIVKDKGELSIIKTDLFNHFFAIIPPMDLTSQPLGLS